MKCRHRICFTLLYIFYLEIYIGIIAHAVFAGIHAIGALSGVSRGPCPFLIHAETISQWRGDGDGVAIITPTHIEVQNQSNGENIHIFAC